jgi:hypothetical protein
MTSLHLYFDPHLNAYCVNIGSRSDMFDRSLTLGIMALGGLAEKDESPWRFKRIAHEDGEWFELLTREEMKGKIDDVLNYEGEAAAKLWEVEQTRYQIAQPGEQRLFEGAMRSFLAFAELGLSLPVVHGTQFVNPRPVLSDDAILRMDALRNAEFERDGEA